MPSLLGYRERIQINVYDCVNPLAMARDIAREKPATSWSGNPSMMMFGKANIGDIVKTNMQVAGQLGTDTTWSVQRWYARTNISHPVFADWAHATVAELVVGHKPLIEVPLSDLLSPNPQTDSATSAEIKARRISNDQLAALSTRLQEVAAAEHPELKISSSAWTDVASVVRTVVGDVPLAIIPVRQRFGVRLYTNRSALAALAESLPATTPESLVWIHLEGIQTRDVG